MKVLVNGVPVPFDGTKRKNELTRIFRELYEQNEIIQEVILDSVRYSNNDQDQIWETVETANELQVSTVSEDTVIADLFGELGNYLPKVLRAFDSIPELLYGEMGQEDWQMVAQLIEGMNWVSQSVYHLQHYAIKKGNTTQAKVLEQFSQDLAPLLAELERSLQASDLTTAADLLKYEMPEIYGALSAWLGEGESG